MSQVELYKAMSNGSAAKEFISKNTLKHTDRVFICKDFDKKVLWILPGEDVDSETMRLLEYAIDMVKDSNYKQINIAIEDREQLVTYIWGLKTNNVTNEDYIAKLLGHQDNGPKRRETMPQLRHVENQKSTDRATQIDASPKPSHQETPKSQPKSSKTSPQYFTPKKVNPSIPAPPSIKVKTQPDPFILPGDLNTGPMIDEFQIAYYEQTHGQNFVLVEELDTSIDLEHFHLLQKHVKLLNKVLTGKISKLEGKQQLLDSIDNLL